ncbi:MAG: hypothetical protein OEX00_07530 [Gammaproteobacteria bacterium]|nr:hypothetical protein [Gammaproteobacteria bacterium]MDH5694049.1 hypothetical protein [Gammaproteobacteria bacterium]
MDSLSKVWRVSITFLLLSPLLCYADQLELNPDRRKNQFETQEGYAIFPFPYSLPGLGSGLSLVGGMSNINNTYLDAYGLILGGDVKGAGLALDDIHLLKETLIMELGFSSISAASVTSYNQRGMRGDKDDYTLIDITDTGSLGVRLAATFFNRRLEFYSAYYKLWFKLKSARDSKGNVIFESENPETHSGEQKIVGFLLDLTDDYNDPRNGFRLGISGWYQEKNQSHPEHILSDINASLYLPIGKRSTWAFNLFKSDATVLSEGVTDRAAIMQDLGTDCGVNPDPVKKAQCESLVDNTIANNKYGTATSLGGFGRLRSYSQGRYSGAHTLFFGSEFRWNVTDEFTPFDIYIIRDVRTAVQFSFFYEIGTIADLESQLGKVTRASAGTGLRIITASGAVFRADFAYGDEGFQPNIFIGYPWEI